MDAAGHHAAAAEAADTGSHHPAAAEPPHPEANPWRQLSRRVAYTNPWVTVFHDEVVRPDGERGIYGVLHFEHVGVGVVPIDEHDRVLLVGQFRYTLDRYSWEIPEGGAALDEDPQAAAARELAEETGYTAETWRHLVTGDTSNSITDEACVLFVATGLKPGRAQPDATEQLQLRWVPFEEALAMIDRGEMRDMMSIVALQRLAIERASNQH